MKENRKKVLYTCGKVFAFIFIPIVLFYLMELYEYNPFANIRGMAQLLNILLFEFIAWFLYFLLGKANRALQIEVLVTMLFGLINHYVLLFRSTPFVPWDVFSIRTAASVAGEYDFTPSVRVVVITLIFLGMLVGLHFCKFDFIEMQRRYMYIVAGVVLCVLFGYGKCIQNKTFQANCSLYPHLFTPTYMSKVNGMAVTFVMNLQYVVVDKPQGYQADAVQAKLESYHTSQSASDELPNVIVIMDEAFADLSVLGEFETNIDYMPHIRSMMRYRENTVSGELNVSVCGGNTANTEFEFLTGHTMAFLPSGSVPYQQYIKEETPSLASHLTGLGYSTYAIHPYAASGWSRDKVYPLLGFEEALFVNEFKSSRYLRKYVSDASSFKKIISLYEQKEEGVPIFVFNVTMQNHGSYGGEYANFNQQVYAEDKNNAYLNQYLSLIYETDRAFYDLVEYFDSQPEKTIILFFGDHQPNGQVTGSISKAGTDQEIRYVVPYLIWANYDIKEERNCATSANYLSAELLDIAGVPLSSYQLFLLDMKETYPVLSGIKKELNGSVSEEDAEEIYLDYQQLQYYLLFDE